MTIETLKSPNPRNRNSISVIKSKFLSVFSMNTLLAILKVTDAKRDVILAGGLYHRFPLPPPPPPSPLGWVNFLKFLMLCLENLPKNSFCSLMKIKLFYILFITLQEHFVIKLQSTSQTIAERCSFFEVQMCMKYMYFFTFYQRGDVAPKEDPVSTLQYLLGPLPKLAVRSIC